MAITTIKADQIVAAANLLLQREIVLPRLIWTQPGNKFVGALDDTVTLRVPAVLAARTRTMRSNTALTADSLTETKLGVKLTDHIYTLLNITDEELTLDILNFTAQILAPQMRAVAEGLENVIAGVLEGATTEADDLVFGDNDEPYDVAVDASTELNTLNVPRAGRILLVGANVENAFLKSDKLSKVNESGTSDALRDATITRVAGFTVIGSNAIDPDHAYAFDRFAVAGALVAPSLPDGAAMKAHVTGDSGIGMRFLRDYNPTNSTGPVDRSLVDVFAGAASVETGEEGSETNKRLVRIRYNSGS